MTTAHLTCVLDERYFDLERMHGAEGARLAAESHMTAINRIETIVNSEADRLRLRAPQRLPVPSRRVTMTRCWCVRWPPRSAPASTPALVSRAPKPSLETGRCLLFPEPGAVSSVEVHRRPGAGDPARRRSSLHDDACGPGSKVARPAQVEAGGHHRDARMPSWSRPFRQ